ncbi:RagB/SusD family nutrient uptake outer membrane protein [Echinicola marina]|uniref:RagB/SusD family nutrient uptake outer membrane protein n=1 Tax=Echinicola marina TaxID=2859768 RepID=UPI001CF70987|nr:RagB/SusD family nutrient uptake outer membrane protein [Echinicola marina]UCS91969.1 RagB/SusD family nutrient uptake outer membrane protein [Echinicola marina]
MKNISKLILTIMIISIIHLLTSCEEFLDEKPNKALIIPKSLSELRSLLDNTTQVMNSEPALGEAATDNVLLLPSRLQRLTPLQKNTYIWAKDIYEGGYTSDWKVPYEQVLYANVVLDELEKFDANQQQQTDWKDLKGSALFYRAYAYFGLARQFCLAYDPQNAENTLGLPIRLVSDVKKEVSRANLKETMDQIIADLVDALPLLGDTSPHKTRPSRVAALAMLSRVYLYMGDFQNAIDFGEQALVIKNTLLDYNSVDSSPSRPFIGHFEEVLYHSGLLFNSYYFFSSGASVDPELVNAYHEDDLRATLFFQDKGDYHSFRGQYTDLVNLFGGLATDEVYLNLAESHARLGNDSEAKTYINALLSKRFKEGTYQETDKTGAALLEMIMVERRKELLMRGIRWGDLKRLNLIEGEEITLSRQLEEGNYTLAPNDSRYAFPIPDDEIALSGIKQNPR